MGEVIEFRRKRLTGSIPADAGKTAGDRPDPLSNLSEVLMPYSAIWMAFTTLAAAACF